jgi:hypothetical protein
LRAAERERNGSMTVATRLHAVPMPAEDHRSTGPAGSVVRLGPLRVSAWSSPSFDATEPVVTGGSESRGWTEVPLCGDVAALVDAGDRLRLLVADVAGHGLEAVPLAGSLHSAFVSLAGRADVGLSSLVTTLDLLVALLGTDEAYATACLLDLHPGGTVEVANCGHPWPLVSDGTGRWRKLAPGRPSLPLGVGARPDVDVHRLRAGSRLVVHTDGIAISQRGRRNREDLDAVVTGVLEGGPPPPRVRADDATIVAGQWAETPEATGSNESA